VLLFKGGIDLVKTNPVPQSASFSPRFSIGVLISLAGIVLGLFATAASFNGSPLQRFNAS
jgi:hypothetical protein